MKKTSDEARSARATRRKSETGHVRKPGTPPKAADTATEPNEAQQRFDQMAAAIDQDFWMMSLDPLRLLYSSPAAKRIWGFDPSEEVADHPERMAERVHPEDLPTFAKLFGALLAGSREAEYRILRKGEIRWLRSRVFPVRDPHGELYRVAGVTEDITARKLVEEQLALHRSFERLIATLSAGLLNVSVGEEMDAAFVDALGKVSGVLGATHGTIALLEAEGPTPMVTSSWRYPDPSATPAHESRYAPGTQWRAALERGEIVCEDSLAKLPGERRDTHPECVTTSMRSVIDVPLFLHGKWIGVLSFASTHEGQRWPREIEGFLRLAATVFANVIDRMRTEQAIRSHRDRLAHVLRLGTVGKLASGIAHELNQPLGAIMNYARGCERRLAVPNADLEEIRGALQGIEEQAVRAADVITALRAVARLESCGGHHDLNVLVRGVARLCFLEFQQSGVTLHVNAAYEPLPVYVDSVQVEQVLLNLIRNAIDAIEAAHTREVRIETRRRDDATAEVAVTDTGRGVDPGRADLIFDEFFTTKPQSLGLGLSIGRSIIEAHGGQLWLDSSTTSGTCFRFTLPLANPEAEPSGPEKH